MAGRFLQPGMSKDLLTQAQVHRYRRATLHRGRRGGDCSPALLTTKFLGFHAG